MGEGLGKSNEEIKPYAFKKLMDEYILSSIRNEDLPDNLEVPEGKDLLEQHKSGFVMNIKHTREDGETEELTADLISVPVLSVENQERIYEVIPEKDKRKKNFIRNRSLNSHCDGIIVKGDHFRMSWSYGERKIIKLYPELFITLKYLNKCSNLDIPT